MCDRAEGPRTTLRDMGQSTEKMLATDAANRPVSPRSIRNHFDNMEDELLRKLSNLRRLRGAMSQDALDMPASILT